MTQDEFRRALERAYLDTAAALDTADHALAHHTQRTYFFLAVWHHLAGNDFLTLDEGELVAFGARVR